jgi:methylphosphotriester-DNA--protein-cysteine methyltransferase
MTAQLSPDAAYAASARRDRSMDGQFFLAVVTTGIYCKPSCPARMPKRANARFYLSTASAEADGFRPCKRCRPA